MPNSPNDPAPGVEDVRTYLEAIPDSQVTSATVDLSHSPLLLMHRVNLLAAFAFANGNLRNSYDRLYSGFKSLFNSQHDKWAELDLAFIFCLKPEVPDLDAFCSNVETDVFFCRKFVVPLALPIDVSLARLPFLPLAVVHGGSFRPPSAQTLLQQSGVPAELSRFIVIQRERGPEGIVEDCVSGRFGEPKDLRSKSVAPIASVETVATSVRATSLKIKNFRAYRKEQTFKLDADVTVLYGPNGFGKTSVFDAIDFAITGGIARFESSNDSRFIRTARHLDSESDDGVVSLSVAKDGEVNEIARKVADRKLALVNGKLADRKGVLSELTNATIPAADRIENLVRLFRATHLFSQEQQELARDFEKSCTLSEQVVSRMLAFEDYSSAVNKAARVLEIVRREIADVEQEALSLTSQLSADREELKRLRHSDNIELAAPSLKVEFASLQKRLKDAGISGLKDSPDVATVRGWRASVESRRMDCQSRIERLAALAIEAGKLPGMRQQIANSEQEIARLDQAIEEADAERATAEAIVNRVQADVTAATTRRAELQSRFDLLKWVRSIRPDYTRRLSANADAARTLESATARHSRSRLEEAKAAADLQVQETQAEQIDRRVDASRTELASVMAFQKSAEVHQSQRKELADILEQEKALMKELEQLRIETLSVSEETNASAGAEVRLAAQIAEADRTQSDLRRILSQLQGYIRDSSCPLCGHDYESRDKLLRSIDMHIVSDEASNARVELLGVRATARLLVSRNDAIGRRSQQIERANSRFASSRTALTAEIDRFLAAAAGFGVSRDVTGQTVIEKLETRREAIQRGLEALEKEADTAARNLRKAQATLSELEQRTKTDASDLADASEQLARCQQELQQLMQDPRLSTVPIDTDEQKLEEWISSNVESLRRVVAEIANGDETLAQQRPIVARCRQRMIALRVQLSSSQSQRGEIQMAVAGVEAGFSEAGLAPDTKAETLKTMIDQESSRHAQLLSLRNSVSNIELAIDAATTAAAHMRLLEGIRAKEQRIENARLKGNRLSPWAKYFDQLSRLVSSQQNEAISTFTREYGPRASILQQRLRSVYGFEEIEISSRESEIHVRVKRRGERLRPTDYFSQSQQQTLLLGLFLTACLSQTWSCFAPVFLDDPVTHFDDLNSYSFLDLVLGLLESRLGQHQFIISTCDEKLLELARQKFRHIGQRARFYRFSAMGSDGPVVDEIM
ncbi:MAG: AAA family ATPase [Silvibacterium sp.]